VTLAYDGGSGKKSRMRRLRRAGQLSQPEPVSEVTTGGSGGAWVGGVTQEREHIRAFDCFSPGLPAVGLYGMARRM